MQVGLDSKAQTTQNSEWFLDQSHRVSQTLMRHYIYSNQQLSSDYKILSLLICEHIDKD